MVVDFILCSEGKERSESSGASCSPICGRKHNLLLKSPHPCPVLLAHSYHRHRLSSITISAAVRKWSVDCTYIHSANLVLTTSQSLRSPIHTLVVEATGLRRYTCSSGATAIQTYTPDIHQEQFEVWNLARGHA